MSVTFNRDSRYTETDCVFVHGEDRFEAGGAVVTPDAIIAYPAEGGILRDWHGATLGTWRSVASWPVRSYMGTRMHQIETRVDGVTYTGRGFGTGMIYRGKRKAGQ